MRTRYSPRFSERREYELRLGGETGRIDGGLNTADLPHTLDTTQSADCLNVWFYEGAVTKRPGQRLTGAVDGDISAAKDDGNGNVYIQADAALYKMKLSSGESERVGTLSTVDGRAPAGMFFIYADAVYFINTLDHLVSEGEEFKEVTPYIPLVMTGRSPSGGVAGESADMYNALTSRFRVSFSGDGSSAVYKLPPVALAEDTVTAEVNGRTMTEGAGFTVNRETSYVTFTSAPSFGTDNVVFTLTGQGIDRRDELTACRYAAVHSGENRIVLGGNGTNMLFYSAPYKPTYFPLVNRAPIGSGGKITGFGRQYDQMAVFKENEIASVSCVSNADSSELSVRIISPEIGCDMPGSIVGIDNRIAFANTERGVCVIISTARENERNIQPVSRNIDSRLLSEDREELQNAAACCFEGRYWLSVGERVYMWDCVARPLTGSRDEKGLRRLAWYLFDNIPALSWFLWRGRLFAARRGVTVGRRGAVVELVRQFDDFGEGIKAFWRSAAMDFGRTNEYKTLTGIWFICRGETSSNTSVRYLFDERRSDVSVLEPMNLRITGFSWRLFSWGRFSWDVPGYFRTLYRRPRRRRVIFFSIELENHDAACDLSLADAIVGYKFEYDIK